MLGGDGGGIDTDISLARQRLSSLYDLSVKITSLWLLLINQIQMCYTKH